MGTAEQREGLVRLSPWQGADGVARRDAGIQRSPSRAQQKGLRADRALVSLVKGAVWEGSQLRGAGSFREEEMEADPRGAVLS